MAHLVSELTFAFITFVCTIIAPREKGGTQCDIMEEQWRPNGNPACRLAFSELPEFTRFGKTLDQHVLATASG